jgi:hypothetical protein
MTIDIHTHIFSDKHYQDYLGRGGHRVDRIITIHDWDLSEREPATPPTIAELIAFDKSKPNVSVIASVDIRGDLDAQARQIDAWFRSGEIVGVKLYPGYQPLLVSDPSMDQFAELCAAYNRPLTVHSGDVYDPRGTAQLSYAHPIHIDALAVRHRKCPIVIAHFGLPYFLETANIVGKNKNVYTDFSAALTDLPADDARALFNQFTADLTRAFAYFPEVRRKTMFGTDYAGEHTYLNQVEPYFRAADKLFSDPAERSFAMGELAEGLFFAA